jgi:hypothetical protein
VKSIREILRLSFSCQLSGRQIATALGLFRAAVWGCLRRAHAANITWPLPDDIDETELYARMYNDVSEGCVRPQPDCLHIFNEYKRKGVTLSLLWEEYKRENPKGYQYTKFCGIYGEWLEKTNLVMRQEHKAGHKAFSDFSGGTLNITDRPPAKSLQLVCSFAPLEQAASHTLNHFSPNRLNPGAPVRPTPSRISDCALK